MTGGVGAVATATPANTFSSGPSSSGGSSGASTSTSKPSGSSSSGNRVVPGFLGLAVAVFTWALPRV